MEGATASITRPDAKRIALNFSIIIPLSRFHSLEIISMLKPPYRKMTYWSDGKQATYI
jgi:hypothetical protein